MKVGDRVYGRNGASVTIATVVRISQTPVEHHAVLRISVAEGPTLEISSGHPTADGRQFGDLRRGDLLDGHLIESVRLIPYIYDRTYDILTDAENGAYSAGGILIGSTLSR